MIECFYTHPVYIRMCDRAVELKERFRNLSPEEKIGTWIVWRSFLGIIVPTRYVSENEWKDKLPEYKVLYWLNRGLDIKVVRAGVEHFSEELSDSDTGTPVFDMRHLNAFMDWCKISDSYLVSVEKVGVLPWKLKEVYGLKIRYFDVVEQMFLAGVMWFGYGKKWNFDLGEWE